jgi:microcystin-dependent protein
MRYEVRFYASNFTPKGWEGLDEILQMVEEQAIQPC